MDEKKEAQSQPTPPVVSNKVNSPLPVESTSSKPRKTLVIVGIFVGIASLAAFLAGGYFLGKSKSPEKAVPVMSSVRSSPSPTPDPTADWNEYRTEVYSFKYPPGWYEDRGKGENDIEVRKDPFEQNDLDEFEVKKEKQSYSIRIWYEDLSTGQSFEQWWQAKINNPTVEDFSTVQKVSVSGILGYRYEIPKGFDGGRVITAMPYKDGVLNIILDYFLWTLEEGRHKFPEAGDIYDQTLSTFKFTN